MFKLFFTFFIIIFSLFSCRAQKSPSEVRLKIDDISLTSSAEEVTIENEVWPIVPNASNRVFGVNLELLFIKYSPRLSYVFSIGYGRISFNGSTKTFRDIRKLNSFNTLKREEFKISTGLIKKVGFLESRLEFLVSAKIFGIYYFNRNNKFISTLLNLEDEFIASSSLNIDSISELDLGVELNLDIVYKISKKFGLGLSISNLYFLRISNGITKEYSVLLDENMKIENERLINRKEDRTSFFDSVNFALVFSYKLGK